MVMVGVGGGEEWGHYSRRLRIYRAIPSGLEGDKSAEPGPGDNRNLIQQARRNPMLLSTAASFASAARNRDPILAVLQRVLPSAGLVLELGSGTGEHAVHFARRPRCAGAERADPRRWPRSPTELAHARCPTCCRRCASTSPPRPGRSPRRMPSWRSTCCITRPGDHAALFAGAGGLPAGGVVVCYGCIAGWRPHRAEQRRVRRMAAQHRCASRCATWKRWRPRRSAAVRAGGGGRHAGQQPQPGLPSRGRVRRRRVMCAAAHRRQSCCRVSTTLNGSRGLPMPIFWRPQFRIGHDDIDADHRYLILLINTVELVLRFPDDRATSTWR